MTDWMERDEGDEEKQMTEGWESPRTGENCYSSDVHITFICRNRTRQVGLFIERGNDPLTMCTTVCVTDA